MQTITTTDWTQITGLDSSKTYLLQAQRTSQDFSSSCFGVKLMPVLWRQSQTVPQDTDGGSVDSTLKTKAEINIYVKASIPVNINVQEVI